MCYNKETSALTFLYAITFSSILYIRNKPNDRWLTLIFLSIGLMQLCEYFMWLDQNCGIINHRATIASYITLLLQPIAFIVGAYYFGTLQSWVNKNSLFWVMVSVIIIIGFQIIKYIIYPPPNLCSKPQGEYKHLIWDLSRFNTPNLIIVLYFILLSTLILCKNKIQGLVYCLVLFLILLFSYLVTRKVKLVWKSLWCWLSNFMPLIPLIFF